MKKKIITTGIFIILAMPLGFWLWCQRPGLAMEMVLPSDAIVFARLSHVEVHLNQIVHSDFGKNIAAIDVPDVMDRNNFSQKDINGVVAWQRGLVRFWNNPLIRKFLSKEASVAVYRKDNRYAIYIMLRLSASARIAEFLGQLSHQWGDDVTLTQQKYHGVVINHVFWKRKDFQFSYVRLRDLLVASVEPLGHLEDVVDVYQHKLSPLSRDPSFIFVQHNAYPKGDALVFVNMNLLSDIWRSEMNFRLGSYGYQAGAFPIFGVSYISGEISKYKMILGLDEKQMAPWMRKTLACPAMANESFRLVPANAIAYNWIGCYDFEGAWGVIGQKLKEYPDINSLIRKVKHSLEKHFHINIKRDVLPVLGHEIGGYLTDVDLQGTYPFPRLLVFVKIQDHPQAEHLLGQLTLNPITMLKSEEYNHVEINYMPLPMGANMDPGYCFMGDYLLIATSRQLLKKSIDAYNDSMRSLVSDDVVKQFSLADGAKFHSVTLMKTAELSRRAQDFLGWVDKYLSSQISMAAEYKQDGNNKALELDQAITDKAQELILAQKKLSKLKATSLTDVSDDDLSLISGSIANLSRETQAIRDTIATYTAQKEDLSLVLANYAAGAAADKLTMFNMETLVSPVLKGLESVDAQAVTVRFGDKILETEILVK